MKRNGSKKYIIIFILAVVFMQNSLLASNKLFDFASPKDPGKSLKSKLLGIVFGLGQNIQNGTSYVSCENCYFTNGLGLAYTLGVVYEQQFTGDMDSYLHHMKWGVQLLYDSKSIEANFTERTNAYFSEYDMNIPLLLKHTNDMSLSSVGVTPFVTYNPLSFFFLRFGVNIDYFLQNKMKHKIELQEKTKILPNGERVEIYIPTKNPNVKRYEYIAEEGDIRDMNKLYISFMPALGFDINLSEKILLSTSFNYVFPMTKISNYSDNFNISSWKILFEMKYNLTEGNSIYKKKKTERIYRREL